MNSYNIYRINGIFLLALFFLAIACTQNENNPFIPDDDCLKASGNTITDSRDVGNFTSIENTIPADVFISQGALEAVRIEAQSNVLEELKTVVTNNRLSIRLDRCFDELENIKIYITIPEIEGLILTGVGKMETVNEVDLSALDVSLTGVGNFELRGMVNHIDIRLSGVGNVNAFELLSDSCDINITGVGDTRITVRDELNVTISGIGTVFYKGSPVINSVITGEGSVVDAN